MSLSSHKSIKKNDFHLIGLLAKVYYDLINQTKITLRKTVIFQEQYSI